MASNTDDVDIRPMPVNIVQGTHAQLVAFVVLNMWPSHFALPLLLAICTFSKKVQRHPTFLNLCITFILVGVSSSLLVYTSTTTGPEPPKMLCLFQASLLYGVPPMASISVLALVYQMFIAIRASFQGQEVSRRYHLLRLWGLLIAPYVCWLISILATAAVGASHPSKISRSRRFFYCSVESPPLTNALTIFSAVILLITLALEAWTIVLFYKRWISLRRAGSDLKQRLDLNMPIRTIAFGIYVGIALSLSLISIQSPASPVPDLIIASAASLVIIIFGTQPDILRAACFWRKTKPDAIEISGWSDVKPSLISGNEITARVAPFNFSQPSSRPTGYF
jgi:hypothetical protein